MLSCRKHIADGRLTWKNGMTFQAYLDSIKMQTDKTPEDFSVLAEQKALLNDGVKASPIVTWLQEDFGLGRGRAMAIVQTLWDAALPKVALSKKSLLPKRSGDYLKSRSGV
jgi:uncharacterized protein DUF4287